MTYLLQLVAMLVALVSQFFESVKKDESGKRRTTKGGLPIVTQSGYVIFLLIFLSFIGTVLSTWFDKADAKRKDIALNDSLSTLRRQNADLSESIKRLSQLDAANFKENLGELQGLLDEQRTQGKQTAAAITDSTKKLRQQVLDNLLQISDFDIAIKIPAWGSQLRSPGRSPWRNLPLYDQPLILNGRPIVLTDAENVARSFCEVSEIQIELIKFPRVEIKIDWNHPDGKCSLAITLITDDRPVPFSHDITSRSKFAVAPDQGLLIVFPFRRNWLRGHASEALVSASLLKPEWAALVHDGSALEPFPRSGDFSVPKRFWIQIKPCAGARDPIALRLEQKRFNRDRWSKTWIWFTAGREQKQMESFFPTDQSLGFPGEFGCEPE